MQTVEKKIKTVEEKVHHFYCDECSEYLGKSIEYDDGWYKTIGELTLSLPIINDRYTISKVLCDDCRAKFLDNLRDILENMGFEN